MNKSKINFLFKKIDELKDASIITEEQDIKSKDFFGAQENAPKSTSTIFNAIGVLLIGLSLITFFAFNWKNFTINIQTLIAFLPLVVTIIMVYFTVEKEDSRWRIYTSIFAPLAIFSTNMLISQIYRADITFYELLFLSLIFYIPIVAIFRNLTSLIIYSAGVFLYASNILSIQEKTGVLNVILVLLPLLGYNIYLLIKDKNKLANIFMYIANMIVITQILSVYELIKTPDYAFLIYLITLIVFKNNKVIRSILNFIFVAMIASMTVNSYQYEYMSFTYNVPTIIFSALSLVGFIYLKMYKNIRDILFLIFVAMVQYSHFSPDILNLLTNVVAVLLGIYYILVGNKDMSTPKTIGGVAVILSVILFRFMNSDLNFTQKSLIFATSGVCFIVIGKFIQNRFRKK